jgi:hypothetical protein
MNIVPIDAVRSWFAFAVTEIPSLKAARVVVPNCDASGASAGHFRTEREAGMVRHVPPSTRQGFAAPA